MIEITMGGGRKYRAERKTRERRVEKGTERSKGKQNGQSKGSHRCGRGTEKQRRNETEDRCYEENRG